jgi:uncharacterized protein (TIGR00369 family)
MSRASSKSETPSGGPVRPERPQTGAEIITGFLPESPFVRHLGISLESLTPGRAILHLPFQASLATLGDVVHGGALASLVDTAAMAAAWSDAEVPEQLRGTTVALTISYVAPAKGEDLKAEASVLRRGRNLCFLEVEVRTSSGSVVAKGLVTYKLG